MNTITKSKLLNIIALEAEYITDVTKKKDFRGGDQFDEYLTIFLRSGFGQTDN